MTSALTANGSTGKWRRIRQTYANQLETAGTVECWRHTTNTNPAPNCTRIINHGDPWHLGHTIDRIHGGDDDHLAIECQPCSSYNGGKTGAAQRTNQHGANHGRAGTPSRNWTGDQT